MPRGSKPSISGSQKRQARVLKRRMENRGETKTVARSKALAQVERTSGGRKKGGANRVVSLKAERGEKSQQKSKSRK